MSKGYVYVFKNAAMPGMVKIGRTAHAPERRAKQLYNTGVPEAFEIQCAVYSPDCAELEKWCHEAFEGRRVNGRREFFYVEPEEAERRVKAIHEDQIRGWTGDFMPDHELVYSDFALSEADLHLLSGKMCIATETLVAALNNLTLEQAREIVEAFGVSTSRPVQ